MSTVSVREAALLTGKSRETINSATKSGKLTFTRDGKNRKRIDVSELERIYPLVKTMDNLKQPSTPVKKSQEVSNPDTQAEIVRLTEKLAASEAMKQNLIDERNRERQQLQDEISNLRENLSKAQDQNSRALLLITDQSQGTTDRVGDWEKSIKALNKRLANHEERLRKERDERNVLKKKAEQYRQALQNERSKPLWQRIFR